MLTYAYCVIASIRRPRPGRPAGVPGASRVRLLDLDKPLYLAVADVPAREYGERAINAHLSDLDWVSRAAVAHESVVEGFAGADAVLPMKLFTIFTSDERAVAHVAANRARIRSAVKRVSHHDEFGVRVVLDRTRAAASRTAAVVRRGRGAAYLTRKKAQHDAAAELSERARETVSELFERLAQRAREVERRSASELPLPDGPLLLDAAFLIPRARARSFRALVAREARALAKSGYGLTLTGPWPPYTFVRE